jgi:lysophospholipase L1-like esterase
MIGRRHLSESLMKFRLKYLLLFCLSAWARLEATGPAPMIVTFGDSTTALRPPLNVYPSLLGEKLRQELGLTIEVVNAGVGSDTTRRAAERFERDVLAKQPRLVVIQFGINDATTDVWKDPPEKEPRVPKVEYRERLAGFIQSCRTQGIHVVLMTPNPVSWSARTLELYGRPPYDRTNPDGLNLNLRLYAEAMRQLAAETDTPLVDVMRAHDDAVRAGGPALVDDGVHPNGRGHQLVADLLMKLLRAHPELLELPGPAKVRR